ncbi:hypothetical protein VaNZ11_009178 [Volvox africanus]|uniref:Peptidase S8/S53 domain-containing protein n=1 Tax=Volvox africanus TaxID=51714 RepID=A0ABQ5S6R7_9CHLO|nr:hypothetical protein VaNZ11_009178 [Volvox africanus]
MSPCSTGRSCGHQSRCSSVSLTTVILITAALVGYAQDTTMTTLKLRAGDVLLQSGDQLNIGNMTGDSKVNGSVVGFDPNARRQYLVQCSGDKLWPMRNDLVGQGVTVHDVVANNTVLVFGSAYTIVNCVKTYGCLVGEYRADYKISPETLVVLGAQNANNRRRFLQAGINSLLGNSTAPSAALLESLLTWQMYDIAGSGNAPKSTDNNRSPSPLSPPPSGPSMTDTNLYGINARLISGLSLDDLTVQVSNWKNTLPSILMRIDRTDPCVPRLADSGLSNSLSTSILVFMCAADIRNGVEWLAMSPVVVWIEPLFRPQAANAISGWILQTGNLTAAQNSNPASNSTVRPYWNANIRGDGIIVGVDDTGLDMSHCSFIDPKFRPGSLRTMFVGNPLRLYLPAHRKVVQYVLPEGASVNWFGDQADGHGSHVSGSVAGAIVDSGGRLVNEASTGSAPNARISLFDTAYANMSGLYIPLPLDDKMLPFHYAVGARLSSESWSQPFAMATTYMEYARQFDAFAWRNPEFLSVISAGNFGFNGQMTTVTSPGTAKNVLTVGASLPTVKNNDTVINRMFLFRYTNAANGTRLSFAMWPRRGSSLNFWLSVINNTEVPVRMATPEDACTNLQNNVNGSVVLVDLLGGSTCPLSQRANNVANRGAVGVIFIADDANVFVDEMQLTNLPTNPLPFVFGFVNRATGLAARSFSRSNITTFNPTLIGVTAPNINLGIDSIAAFSSNGPLKDGRIKPDLVAPGGAPGVVSADASNFPIDGTNADITGGTCSNKTIRYQGTSMSAPLVAGHLALMRQYFRDGFYPSGLKGDNLSVSFEPSGMLLKAAAIAGARSLAGGYALSSGRIMGASPDGFQGWGRLDLSGALPLPGLTNVNYKLQVADYGIINNGEMIFLRGLKATGTGPVYATLVWYDYPASGSSIKDLYNDLDFGYQINQRNVSITSYLQTRTDNVNTVERIELTTLKAGDLITFVVHGRDVRHRLLTTADAQLPQRWAVAVVGHFIGVLRSQYNPAYVTPNRLLMTGVPTPSIVQLSTSCMSSINNTVTISNTTCLDTTVSTMVFTEERDVRTGFYFYTIRDPNGLCLSVTNTSLGSRAIFQNCNTTVLTGQKWALFRNRLFDGTFLFTPQNALGVLPEERRCLRATLYGNTTGLSMALCSDEDTLQSLRIGRSTQVRSPPPLPPTPPSPSPPPSLPMGVDAPWFPYPLTFRLDFYPIGGKANDYDYDYASDQPTDYGTSISNMDLTVAWTWGNMTYQVTPDNFAVGTAGSVAGAVHGGDNMLSSTMYELVHFQTGMLPPLTVYHICAAWGRVETPQMKVVASVYQGYRVASSSKVIDASGQLPYTVPCNPLAPGFIFSFNFTNTKAPPSPPSPPPPSISYSYPLLFRADWSSIGGTLDRGNRIIDLDLVVSWRNFGNYTELGYSYRINSGGRYPNDNRDTETNYEIIYWPMNEIPPSVKYDACVRWYGPAKPLTQVTLSIFYAGALSSTNTSIVDTTYQRPTMCNSSVIGYMGSFDLSWKPLAPPRPPPPMDPSSPNAPGLPAPLSPPPRPPPPSPQPPQPETCGGPSSSSNLFGLSFRTQWAPSTDAVSGPTTGIIYDWDMIVAWTFGGSAFELAQYNRFVAGGVHGGDNINIANKTNGEVAFWPTGVTGQQPQPADYHVCVRWYQSATLNVTLTVSIGARVVKTTSTVLSSSAVLSKVCAPGYAGYVGSFTYAASNLTNAGGGANSMLPGLQALSSMSLNPKAAIEVTGSASVTRASADGVPAAKTDPIDAAGAPSGTATTTSITGLTGGVPNGASNGASAASAAPAATAGAGAGEGGSSEGSDGSNNKRVVVPIAAAVSVVGLMAGLTVVAMQWRRARARAARVMAL